MNIDKDIERVRNIKYLELRGKIDGQFVRAEIPEEDKQAMENVLSEFQGLREFSTETVRRNAELQEELETYKKITDLMTSQINNYDAQLVINRFRSKEDVLDWAKREVENDVN